jgi:hypothetical protein
MRRQQRAKTGVNGVNHQQSAVVGDLRHVQAAVLRRYLHAETAQVGKALHVFVRNLGLALDDTAVNSVEKLPQLAEKLGRASLLGVGRPWKRVYKLQRKTAEKQLFGE